MNGMREVEGVDVQKLEKFPFSGVKVLGGVQIGLGIACMFLGLVDLIMFIIIGESTVLTDEKLLEIHKTAKTLTISSTGLWCGLWYITCGVMAVNISEKKKSNIFCYKISFMILSILCASLFGPICMFVNAYGAIMREKVFTTNFNWLVPLMTAFFAFVEIAIAIASSAVSCCCSAVSQAKVRVFVAGGFPQMQRERSVTSPDYFKATKKQNEKHATSPDYFKATKRTDPVNFSTTKRLEWPDTGELKNNTKRYPLSKI